MLRREKLLLVGWMTFFTIFQVESSVPDPIALYPLNGQYGARDIGPRKNPAGNLVGVKLATGQYGQPDGSYQFSGSAESYIEFPNNGGLDARYAQTVLAWVYPESLEGPLFSYQESGKIGVHLLLQNPYKLFAKYITRDHLLPYPVESDEIRSKAWNFIGATYDNSTGIARLWVDGKRVAELTVGTFELATQGAVRMGAQSAGSQFFRGRVSCVQVYDKALTGQLIETLRDRCPVQVNYNHIGCYGDKLPRAIPLLEGGDPLLTGNPSTREDAVLNCARVALKRGFMYFAIQNGGQCLSSLTAHVTYSTYGLTSGCKDGKGGKNANDVYEVVMFGKQTCWSGWIPHDRSCLKYFNQLKTWTAAQAFCESTGGSLVKLPSEEKSYFVFLWLLRPIHQVEPNVWVGLSRDPLGNFQWPDGTRADYTNWGLGNPDNKGGKENSTEVDTYSGLWNDVEFDYKNPFVCEKVAPSKPHNLVAMATTSQSAQVTWSGDDSKETVSYYVEYRAKGSNSSLLKVVQKQTTASLINLQANNKYEVRVRGVSASGGGPWSEYTTWVMGHPVPPRIDSLPASHAQALGETMIITCPTKGEPEPAITWYKEGKLIQHGKTLRIADVKSRDLGLYTCRASNGFQPDDVESVTVAAMTAPTVLDIWTGGDDQAILVRKGQQLTLRCEAMGAAVSWYKDEDPADKDSTIDISSGELVIKSVDSDHYGEYECRASNGLGTKTKKITVTSDDQRETLEVAVGVMTALLILLLVVVIVLLWLLLKSRRRDTSSEEPKDSPPPAPRGLRPCASDILISEANHNSLPRNKHALYAPLSRSTGGMNRSQSYML